MALSIVDASSIRISVGGIPAIDALSFSSSAHRLMIVGAASALFEAASGVRNVQRGALRIGGLEARMALSRKTTAGAPINPTLPRWWTPRTYVEWNARLFGRCKKEARLASVEALGRLGIDPAKSHKLGKATTFERRAAVVAGAWVTGAPTLLIEDPTVGLADDVADAFGRRVAELIDPRRWIIFSPRLSIDSPLASRADEVIVLAGSAVVAQGPMVEVASRGRTYALRIGGEAQMFADALISKGVSVKGHADRMWVTLGEGMSTRDILSAALETGALVHDLHPTPVGSA